MTLISPLAQLEVGSKFYRVKHNHMHGAAHGDPLPASARAASGLEPVERWARPRPRVCTSPQGDLSQVLSPPGLLLLSHNLCLERQPGRLGLERTAPRRPGGCPLSQLASACVLLIFPDVGGFEINANLGRLKKKKSKNTHPLVTRSQKDRHFKSVCI